MNYIAHVRKQDGAIQTVSDHLLEVKVLCEMFGDKLGVRHIAGLAGVLHDLGNILKYFSSIFVKQLILLTILYREEVSITQRQADVCCTKCFMVRQIIATILFW